MTKQEFETWRKEWLWPVLKKWGVWVIIIILTLLAITMIGRMIEIGTILWGFSAIAIVALCALALTRPTRHQRRNAFYCVFLLLFVMVVISTVSRMRANAAVELARKEELAKKKADETAAAKISPANKPSATQPKEEKKKEEKKEEKKKKDAETEDLCNSGATDHPKYNCKDDGTDNNAALAARFAPPISTFPGASYNTGKLTLMFTGCEHTTSSTVTCRGWAMTSEPGPVNLSLEEGGYIADDTGGHAVIYRGHIEFGNAHQAMLNGGHPEKFTFWFDDPSNGTSRSLLPTLSIRWKYNYYESNATPNVNRDVPVL